MTTLFFQGCHSGPWHSADVSGDEGPYDVEPYEQRQDRCGSSNPHGLPLPAGGPGVDRRNDSPDDEPAKVPLPGDVGTEEGDNAVDHQQRHNA